MTDKKVSALDTTTSAASVDLLHLVTGGTGAYKNEHITVPNFRGYADVRDYGADPTGAADSTTALRSWLAVTGDAHVLGGPGDVYLVSPPSAGDVILPISSGSAVKIIGNGATIKVADSSGEFFAILGSDSIADDLSNVAVDGVIFDHNRANNTYGVTGGLLDNQHRTFSALKGDDVWFKNNIIKNAVCTNSVVVNGSDGAGSTVINRPVVSGNVWTSVGAGAASAYDHSTIYTNGTYEQILNNQGYAESINAFGAGAFIECHGTAYRISGNECLNFAGFANVTGVRTAGDTDRVIVNDNKSETIQFGIRLISLSSSPHTSGYGLNGVDVCDNQIRIKQTSLAAGTSDYYIAAGIQAGATLPVKDVRFFGNHVIYDEESTTPDYTALSIAIGAQETTGTTIYENIQIFDNTIVNAPSGAIGLGFGGGVFKNCHIGPNTLTNPGAGLATEVAAHLAGIILFGNEYTGSLTIDKQTIIDNFDTTRLVYGVFASPGTDSTAIPCAVDLDIKLTGSTTSAFSRSMANTNNRLLPLMSAKLNIVPSFTSHTFKVGTEILDTSNDLTYKILVEGGTWSDHAYASGAPGSGTHQVGSTRIDTTPSASGTIGWVCTAAGSPGTWNAFGTIAA